MTDTTPSDVPEPIRGAVPASSRVGATPWILAVVLLAAGWASWPLLNYDVAGIAVASGRLYDGEHLYTQIKEPNPPLVFWLEMVPVAVHRLLGLPLVPTVLAFVQALVLVGLALADRVMRRLALPSTPGDRAALLAVIVVAVIAVPAYEFGQREHLMIALATPWILAAAGAARGLRLPTGLAVAVGAAAALGFLLKPHYPPIAIAIELVVLVRGRDPWRSLRVENLVLGALAVVYLGVILLGTGYVGQLDLWIANYGAFDAPFLARVLALDPAWLVGALVTAVLLGTTPDRAGLRPLPGMLAVAVVVGALAAWQQGKGWPNHALPAIAWALVLVGASVLSVGDDTTALLPRPARAVRIGAVIAGVLAVGGRHAVDAISPQKPKWYPCPSLSEPDRPVRCDLPDLIAKVDQLTAPGDRVAWVSTDGMQMSLVLARADLSPTMRVNAMLIPGAYPADERAARPFRYHDDASLPEHERLARASLRDELREDQPVLVVVDRRPVLFGFGGPDEVTGFDMLAWMRRDAAIGDVLDHDYELVPDEGVTNGTIAIYRRRAP